MINKEEIKFNCYGLVSTWFDKYADDINETNKVTISFNNETKTSNDPAIIANQLSEFIFSGNKGTVDFIINNTIKEKFDIN